MRSTKKPFVAAMLVVAVLSLFPKPAPAVQQRQVELLLPRGGTRGTTVEVVLQGMDLADPREIIFYRGGIVATDFEPMPDMKYPLNLAHGGRMVEQLKVRFKIAADCPLGEHPLRLRTGTSLGTLCTFWVGPFPTVDEREKTVGDNDSPDHAQPIALNSTVSGRIQEGLKLDRDLYRVDLKAGQRLSVEVEALRLCMMAYGDSEHDLMACVLDAQGRELARVDDSARFIQDPQLSFVAPRDGAYLVEIRQSVYRADHWGYYRAHIGTFASPQAVYPAGGRAGESLALRLAGDASGETTQTVTLPGQAGRFDFAPGGKDASSPSPFELRVSPYANVLELEPNDKGLRATAGLSVPVALNGVIEKNGDVDYFWLPVTKGASYRIRVFGRSLGSPLDPKIWLQPAGSAPEAIELEADDSQLNDRELFALSRSLRPKDLLDPSVVFTPKQTGVYWLGIADTRNLGGASSVYRIEVEPVSDAVSTYVFSTAFDAFEQNRLTGFIVPKGNRWTLNVSLGEGQGNRYKGDLELEAVGLPAGVEMIAPRITGGLKMIPVQFVADSSAVEQSAFIELVARPSQTGVSLASGSQQAVPFTNHSGGHAWHYVVLDRYALAVTRPAPFHIELTQPAGALPQTGELALKVEVRRDPGFKETIDIQPDWLPPGIAGESAQTIAPGQTEAKFMLHADARAVPGKYKITMNATTTAGLVYSGIGRIRTSSPFVELTVAEPYLAMNLRRTAVERGGQADMACEIKLFRPFSGEAVAALRGLPHGVSLREPLPRFSSADKTVTFHLEASPEALVGQYTGIACEVTVNDNGQPIHQQTGSAVLRVDPARSGTNALR